MKLNNKMEIITKNATETKKLGALLAQTIVSSSYKGAARGGKKNQNAIIISLEGDLGSGKTTFTQGFAGGFEIKEKIQSPTFVILKIYKIVQHLMLNNFVHIDAYRTGAKNLKILSWRDFVKNPRNIILIEWGDRIKKILPKS